MEEDDDSKLSFDLQLQEALLASFRDGAGSSSNATHLPDDVVFEGSLSSFLEDEAESQIVKYEQQLLDEAEMERIRTDLSRQIHDHAFARQVATIPEEEWRRTGDNFKRPHEEGSSSSNDQVLRFRVYVKGLLEKKTMVGGIGVAICDQHDGLMFEISKGLSANEHEASAELVEVKALIEGLHVAVMLNLKKIKIVSDNPLIYQYVTGKKTPMKPNVAPLADQMNLLLRKFIHVRASLVEQKDVKLPLELARNAMTLQVSQSAGNRNEKNTAETCAICFEDTSVDQMFLITSCLHSYCFSCMSKHVHFKLLQGVLPKCPHENCKSKLKLHSCKKFLTPELFNIMSQRMKEASIPAEEKIYCPYPRCSTLLSKAELQGSKGKSTNVIEQLGARKCPKCHGFFCINCKVPWHANMTCVDYKRRNPYPSREEKKLQSLATQNLWRLCPKCSNMVSLARGCNHIYCRCGHEFCYKCGAKWRNKKATCTCPIWDERNIIYNERNRHQLRRG
ncbi:hypothetical protein Pfo_007182 [Paulownia fortunei]|nr:hypothetical protein Pfo_007182 [Paulownia fortunei]